MIKNRVFIAEKPELGRAIAEALISSTNDRKIDNKTHIIIGNNIITWAFGHIMKLADPEMYDKKYEKWIIQDLPFNISYPFKRIPLEYSKTQLNLILKLINDNNTTEIIHCGDADEEGQILIDEILYYSRTQKPILRCLINDITPKAILKSITEMKSNSHFKGLSESGFARSEADWIVGLNLTRLYSLLNYQNGGKKGVISVGRVQTPILALIVNRDLENKNHVSQLYYAINGEFKINNEIIKLPLKVDDKIEDENLANKIKAEIENQQANLKLTINQKLEYPPLPYNLLNLQAEANKLFGFSAKKTLEITQELREKYKAISYNRSDCEYLPENIYNEAPLILEAIKNNFNSEEIGQANVNLKIKSKAFDDSKLSAHYGIIPTQAKFDINKLKNEQKLIYTLITQRFLMQFYEPCKYDSYNLEIHIKDYIFSSTFRNDTELGFKKYFKINKDDNEDDNFEKSFLNNIKNNDLALCQKINIKPEKTKPKPFYTMTTLLKDLNNVAKYVKDERIKKLLIEKDKDKKGESGGIGTPATRSSHIETLIERGYIVVSNSGKKQIVNATELGVNLITNLPTNLTNPDMTALWFESQKEIQEGKLSRKDFLTSIENFTKNIIDNEINSNKRFSSSDNVKNADEKIECPKCKKGFLREINGKFGKFFSCSEYSNGCDFKAKSINGKPELEKKSNIETSYKCPKCNANLIKRESKNEKNKYWYGCSEWKNGCNFMCPEKNNEPDFSSNSNTKKNNTNTQKIYNKR
ncbi:DNA topoisomerase III [Campylobacter lari]|nr:DNA topoisomerase III [Campylobacter lari]EAK5748506.1 DNA topoisomerase III [Campylobacter lari]EAK9878163.1 DNA topoisomerase III [Campylobacter lari]